MYRKTFLKFALLFFPLLVLVPGLHILAQAGGGQVLYLPIIARSTTCSVPSVQYPTIQSAVDGGCVIINLTAALYTENIIIQDHIVTIRGQGPASTIVDGNASDSVIVVEDDGEMTLDSVTVMNGYNTSGGGGGIRNQGLTHLINTVVKENSTQGAHGGGIASYGTLILEASSIINNSAQGGGEQSFGGGIYIGHGTVHITDTIVSGNGTTVSGGGIYVESLVDESIVTVVNSQIINNAASHIGGGLMYDAEGTILISNTLVGNNVTLNWGGGVVNFGNMQVVGSQITGNVAGTDPYNSSCGGGIYTGGISVNEAFLLIERTEIRDNVVDYFGGGICNWLSVMEIHNSLIAGNTSMHEGGGLFDQSPSYAIPTIIENTTFFDNYANFKGGAILNYLGFTELVNVTMSQNDAPEGATIFSVEGDVQMINSIMAGDSSSQHCDGDSSADLISLGHNIASDNSCNLLASGDMPNTDPLLGPLQNNGGPTHTTAIPSNSPAKDAADNTACPPTDQRGVIRPQGAGCDIGAYEYNG